MFLQTISFSCLLQATHLRADQSQACVETANCSVPLGAPLLSQSHLQAHCAALVVGSVHGCAPPSFPTLLRKHKAVEKDPVATSTDNLVLTLTVTLTPQPVADSTISYLKDWILKYRLQVKPCCFPFN